MSENDDELNAYKTIEAYSQVSSVRDALNANKKPPIDLLELWNLDLGYVRKDERGKPYLTKKGKCFIEEKEAIDKAKIFYDIAFEGNPPEQSYLIPAYSQYVKKQCEADKNKR